MSERIGEILPDVMADIQARMRRAEEAPERHARIFGAIADYQRGQKQTPRANQVRHQGQQENLLAPCERKLEMVP